MLAFSFTLPPPVHFEQEVRWAPQ